MLIVTTLLITWVPYPSGSRTVVWYADVLAIKRCVRICQQLNSKAGRSVIGHRIQSLLVLLHFRFDTGAYVRVVTSAYLCGVGS